MVNYCCVTGCGRNSRGSSHLFYYSIPKEKQRQEVWCEVVGRLDLLKKSPDKRCLYRVCSRHFSATSIKTKHLSVTAVPTLFLPGSGTEKQDDPKHLEVTCNNCNNPIVGFRYKCVKCDNYDLCSRCEMLETHEEHFMLRIPTPVKFDTVKKIITKWQHYSKKVDSGHSSSDDEPITKYKSDDDCVDLSEDVKEKIRLEVERALSCSSKSGKEKNKKTVGKKRKTDGDRPSKKHKGDEDIFVQPMFTSEVAFADVNEIPIAGSSQVVEVKDEQDNVFNVNLEGPEVPSEQPLSIMDIKLSDDLTELMMEVNDQKIY